MQIKEIIEKSTSYFREKKIETPRLDAEILIAEALQLSRIQLYLKFDQPLKNEEVNTIRDRIRRRGLGEPVAYILGYKEFFSHSFKVNSHVLIPRPETEQLVEEVITYCQSLGETNICILDIGTGSGCIGLSLAKALPNAKILMLEISESAKEVFEENAQSLKVLDQVSWIIGDASQEVTLSEVKKWLEKNNSLEFHCIVANPPYVERNHPLLHPDVEKYEPHLALFAPDKGMALIKLWAQLYSNLLGKKGMMMMELDPDQADEIKKHFEDLSHFNHTQIVKDLSQTNRFIVGEKKVDS